MTRPMLLVSLLALAAAAAAAVLAGRRRHAPRSLPPMHEDCAVSECAADGVPLSAYAG